jgi:hypothetical protein
MRIVRACGLLVIALCLAIGSRAAAEEGTERVDEEIVKKIKDEGLNHSQAMSTISYLTDVCGPRLTASPATRKAGEWAKGKLSDWKLENAHLESWGPFGRGWSVERFSVNMVAPNYSPLIAFPKAWSPSTPKVVRGKPIYLDVKNDKDLDQYRGKLNKAIVLLSPPRELKPLFDAPAQRQSDTDLLGLANGVSRSLRTEAKGPPPAEGAPASSPAAGTGAAGASTSAAAAPEARSPNSMLSAKWRLVHEEGAAVVLEPGRGDGGTVFVTAANMPSKAGPDALPIVGGRGGRPGRVSPWSPDAPQMIPQAVLAVEHYNRLIRMLEFGVPVEVEIDMLTQYHQEELNSFNIVAEIPGGDLKDEIVMLGAHFDSWHTGSGATDNAIGCGVAMEAVRILQAIGVKPRRTIRIALWTGEEQGLLGSKAYVTEHFGKSISASERAEAEKKAAADKPATDKPTENKPAEEKVADKPAVEKEKSSERSFELKPEHARLAAYFNLDNGGGKIRGVYLQKNEAMRPIFRAWIGPFAEMGASTISLGNTGGTDHLSFDAVGLPGFQFIQDQLEYSTRTHHSSMDVYDRLVADDVKQASVIMASFVYNAAMRDEKLPRKPLGGEVIPTKDPAPATPPAATAATPAATTTEPATK